MRYLKKSTVIQVISLAQDCPEETEFSREEIALGLKGQLKLSPQVHAYNDFLKTLSDNEKAELVALLWLGRNHNLSAEDWSNIVANVRHEKPRDLYSAPKQKLPQFLRYGMERLARHRAKKPAQSKVDEERRLKLVGQFTIESYQQTYGKDRGWYKLVELMIEKGLLDDPNDRELFGLPRNKEKDELDFLLRNRKEAGIRVGLFREKNT